jgi:dipeptidyl aminopeptidase/acylaminoacyl peptidase
VKPYHFDSSQKYPLLALLHGGPVWHSSGSYDFESRFYASQGYVVFMPNFRGSFGYGFEFCQGLRADWGNTDYEDVMSGVDALIEAGFIDPEKLGVTAGAMVEF